MPREDWIRANARLINDVVAEPWLTSLQEMLKGEYPRGQDAAGFGFTRTPLDRSQPALVTPRWAGGYSPKLGNPRIDNTMELIQWSRRWEGNQA